LGSKLLAIVIGEIAICLMRLNDLAHVTGYVARIDSLSDQIIGPPGAPAIVANGKRQKIGAIENR
jgi:hypothetical protein